MLTKIALAGAMLASLSLPSVAATNARQIEPGAADAWYVLQDAGGTACYVANRKPGPDEARLSGGLGSEFAAQARLAQIAQCEAVNVEHSKSGTASNT
jgi:hypothetical protein